MTSSVDSATSNDDVHSCMVVAISYPIMAVELLYRLLSGGGAVVAPTVEDAIGTTAPMVLLIYRVVAVSGW